MLINAVKAAVTEHFAEIVRLRRSIHRHPELAGQEHATARLVHETLSALQLPVQTGLASTGLMATLTGGRPGPTVLLRADMDALPIQEETGVEYASVHPGVMHACGHDVHTASLLGTAIILASMRATLAGTVRMVFQPSEEVLPGGAKPMIDDGVLLPCTESPAPIAAFAQHVTHTLPSGTIGVCNGMFMASSDEIYIRVHGEGGHAAEPHRLDSDTVLAAAHVILALQSVVSRHCPPEVPSVLSIGKVHAPGATNVMPHTVYLEGTFRAMDETWRSTGHRLIRHVAETTATTYGATVTVEIRSGYPALYNDPATTALTRTAAIEYVGEAQTTDVMPWFASEDFAYFLNAIPGTLYLVGAGSSHAIHTSEFLADDAALAVGTGFLAYLALRFLTSHSV